MQIKLDGQRRHYDLQKKGGWTREGIMMYTLKGWMYNRGHYDVQRQSIDMMCKLKGWMDKGGHNDMLGGWIM